MLARTLRLRYATLGLMATISTYVFLDPSVLRGGRGYDILAEHDGPASQVDFGSECSPFSSGSMSHVTIVLKIGAGETATKLPAYTERLDHCGPDLLIFSDRKDQQSGYEIVDALANLRPEYRNGNPDFDIYDRIQDMNMTEGKSHEGWRLDKYKFLPMMEWTAYMRPNSQWFVFVELDTYVNYDNMHRFLTTFNPRKAYYFGSPVWPKIPFAHGGSGYVLSRGALEKMMTLGRRFREDQQLPGTHFFGQDIERFCCGDEVLAHVLKQCGISLRGYWPMFNGEKPSTLPFNKEQWCEAVLTLHHLGDDDFADLEKWETIRSQRSRPLTFEGLFAMIEPHIQNDAEDWSNMSEDAEYGEGESPAVSFDRCYEACLNEIKCMQFEYSAVECRLGYSVRLGHRQPPADGRKWTSGWMKERTEAFKSAHSPCQGARLVHSNP